MAAVRAVQAGGWVARSACGSKQQRPPAPRSTQQRRLARPLPVAPRAGLQQESELSAGELSEEDQAYVDQIGNVRDLMSTGSLRSCTPDQPLSSAASKLDKVTGLAVVDGESGVVVGVISIRDINRVKKQGVALSEPVGRYMSTPPIVVRPDTRISEAAGIMLLRKIHRLPVVDEAGRLVGIISRTDVFQRALASKADFYRELAAYGEELAAGGGEDGDAMRSSLMATLDEEDDEEEGEGGAGGVSAEQEAAWAIKYLYDGDCSMCLSLVAMLRRQDGGVGRIRFVNIASMAYDPADNEGILYEEAMETIHAIQRDGTLLKGPAALQALYRAVGLGWAAQLGDLPILSDFIDFIYELLSKWRMPIGKGMDAVMAMRRMKMTSEGIEHCVDDEEECSAEW